jgi:26S proteasome regulatory subunit (ATPase 3-interacting protein)
VAKAREKIANNLWAMIEDMLPDQQAKEEHREKFDLDG